MKILIISLLLLITSTAYSDDKISVSYGVAYFADTLSLNHLIKDDLYLSMYHTKGAHTFRDEIEELLTVKRYHHQVFNQKVTGINLVYSPYGGHFSVYGGVGYNKSTYDSFYEATRTTISNRVRLPDISEIAGEVTWNNISPTFGIRIGNPYNTKSRLSVYLDIGAYYFTGMKESAVFQSHHTDQSKLDELQGRADEWVSSQVDKYRDQKFLPKAEIGLAYKF